MEHSLKGVTMRIKGVKGGEFNISEPMKPLFRRAQRFFKEKDPERAVSCLEQRFGAMSKDEKVVVYLTKGDGFSFLARWQEALCQYEQALLLVNEWGLGQDQRAYVERLLNRARFFTFEEKEGARFALALAANPFYGKEFLDILLDICRSQAKWEQECALCDAMLESEENHVDTLFAKACALMKMRKGKEAIPLFQKIVRARPSMGEAYLWLGTAFMLEGRDKCLYFLQTAYRLGQRLPAFFRNLFLVSLIVRKYELAQEVLPLLADNEEEACKLIKLIMPAIKPRMLYPLEAHLQEFRSFYEARKGASRKHLRILAFMQQTIEHNAHLLEEVHQLIVPLASHYWGTPSLKDLAYEECMRFLTKRGEQEITDFFEHYRGSIASTGEYENFVADAKKRRVPIGILLLTFSSILDLFAQAAEELRLVASYIIKFNPSQEETHIYKDGIITFGGSSMVFIKDEKSVLDEFKREIGG